MSVQQKPLNMTESRTKLQTWIESFRIHISGVRRFSARTCEIYSDALRRFADFVGDMRDESDYDYVIIDCPPGFTAVSIAGISVSDDIIIPAKVDAFAISGIDELTAQIRAVQTVRSSIRIAGVLVTMWHNAPVVTQGEQYLRAMDVPVFETTIRRTDKMDEATFARQPISTYSRWCAAARDYRDFVDEYLGKEAADDE